MQKRTDLFDFVRREVGEVGVFAVLLFVRVHHHSELLTGSAQQVEYNAEVWWTGRRGAARHA